MVQARGYEEQSNPKSTSFLHLLFSHADSTVAQQEFKSSLKTFHAIKLLPPPCEPKSLQKTKDPHTQKYITARWLYYILYTYIIHTWTVLK